MSGSDRRGPAEGRSAAPAVCVVGLGRVGLAIAAALTDRRVPVTGVDSDPARVAVATGKPPADDEPGVAAVLSRAPIRAGTSHDDAIRDAAISYVIVATPSDARGGYELGFVRAAFKQVGRALAQDDQPHTVVLASTVLPGATRYALAPVLEQASGRRIGDGLSLCYSPPFIALGSVMHGFLHPDFALLGVAEGASDSDVQALYAQALGPHVPVRTMSIENAELTKVAVNTFLTMKISYANTLAAICDRLPAGDVDVVTEAVGADSRIGPKLLRGGLGYGGPCLPRDNAALALLASSLGVTDQLARATDAVDQELSAEIVASVMRLLAPGDRAVVLGLAYKPGTSVVEASPGLGLAQSLAAAGLVVVGHDPRAAGPARRVIAARGPGPMLTVLDDPAALPPSPDLVVLTTPDPALADLALRLRPRLLVDPWRALGPGRVPVGTRLVQRGRPSSTDPLDAAYTAVRRLSAPDQAVDASGGGGAQAPVARSGR